MTIDEIKRQVTTRDVLSMYGIKVSRSGFCNCPVHQEKTASVKVYKDNWHCYGCHAGGDVIDLVQRIERCDFKTAFIILGGTYDLDEKTLRNERKRAEMARIERERIKEQKRIDTIKKADAFRIRYRKNLADMIAYKQLTKDAIPGSDAFWDYLDKYHMALIKDINMMGGATSC